MKAELLALLDAQLHTLLEAHRAAREGATHEEAKPENDKDTRALEQSYLARGQAARIEELRAARSNLLQFAIREAKAAGPAQVGDVVTLEDEDGQRSQVWLLPFGGGTRLAGGSTQVLSPRSPLGQSLIGRLVDDEIEAPRAGGNRLLRLVALD